MTRLRIGLCSADHLKSFPRAPAITQINVLRPFDPGDCMDQTRRARSDAPQRGRTLRRRTICADLTADRKSVVKGKSVSVRVDLGGRRIIKKDKYTKKQIK